MKHPDIEEHQVIDRYLMGKLLPEEAEQFEEHYLSCQQCLDQLALGESMQRGFKRAAGQDAAHLAVIRQLALFAWLSRLGRSRQAAVLAMALLVVVVAVLPGSLALRKLGEVDQELAETHRALAQERERAAAGSRTAAEVKKLRSELDASRRDLTREREARTQATQQLEEARAPQGNVPILFLGVVRGASSDDATLFRPPANDRAVFSLQLDTLDGPIAPSYQAILRNASGKEIWRGTGLELHEGDVLNLSLPGSLLEPGVYTITVEGAGAASRFSFRVRPRQ